VDNKQKIRLFFLIVIAFVSLQLFSAWQQKNQPKLTPTSQQTTQNTQAVDQHDLPVIDNHHSKSKHPELENVDNTKRQARIIEITTDTMHMKIDRLGGEIVFTELTQYPQSLENKNTGFIILDENNARNFIAQSGLLNQDGPDSHKLGKALYTCEQASFKLAGDNSEQTLTVDLKYVTKTNVNITKRFIFSKGSYEVAVKYLVDNKGATKYNAAIFGRLKRQEKEQKTSFMNSMRNYVGAAVSTDNSKYKKISFGDMKKKNFEENVAGGWVAMVEHYFTTAWIPTSDETNLFKSEDFGKNIYGISFIGPNVEVLPGEHHVFNTKLFVGPEIAELLSNAAPGLELTIDYGFLWFLSQSIFWILKHINNFVHNWGFAIILTTVLIKGLFYKLSASSYRSMARMRNLQPKMELLKTKHGDNKQAYGAGMMELYRKEKVNPLGGCLPILVQIPVFIALYYVLLESVELRQSPFIFWIKDLSLKDPYYVLPVIMGITMFMQQRLNPTPPDPMQAKVMMFMPVVFTFLFLSFPSGLVLYWVINNTLSIAQQWMITRSIEKHHV
jgi:YidC/Oxa1 family membrane protein insertase